MIGVYPTDMVSLIEEEIREHSASVLKVLNKSGYECCTVELLPWEAENINTPRHMRHFWSTIWRKEVDNYAGGVTLEQAVECICQRVHKYEKSEKSR